MHGVLSTLYDVYSLTGSVSFISTTIYRIALMPVTLSRDITGLTQIKVK